MKTGKAILIGLMSMVFISAHAQSMTEMMRTNMQQQLQNTCSDTSFLQCMGMKKAQCLSVTKKALKKCDSLFPKNDAELSNESKMMAHGQCVEKNLQQLSGISEETIERCDSAASPPPVMMPGMPGG